VNVLSIDGGGIRGIIPAMVLAELEARTGRPAAELFDLVAGTSTGGIIACALGTGRPAAEIVRLYLDEGPEIFSRSLVRRLTTAGGLLDERYDDDALDAALDAYLGSATLGDSRVDVLITAYDLHARATVFFKSWREEWRHLRMRDAARATAAAPTYFEPLLLGGRSLVDGGVFATNPAMSAYAEAARLGHGDRVLVSLGTGRLTKRIDHEDAVGWGQLEWVRPLLDVVFDGVAAAVDYQLDHLLGDRHHRFQVALDRASDALDDASERNLALLQGHARELIAARSAELDALAAAL
jgi:patatin-like phospholipase/acyl hydrolase